MKKSTLISVAAMAAAASVTFLSLSGAGKPAAAAPVGPGREPAFVAAGPGRVEPISEEINISAEVSGKLMAVLADEGDAVRAGQSLAIIENRDYRARVASAEAELGLKEAELRRLRNGARAQERREADAAVAEADAILTRARADQERAQSLLADGVVSQSDADKAIQDLRVADARARAAKERRDLIEAGAREEDRAGAESSVALARAKLDDARAAYDKTVVRAPIAGVILRRHRKAGESVSTQFDSPILTMADRSRLRVRVDIDEADVSKVTVGQPAYVTADAFGSTRFPGHVVRVGQELGRKNVRTDDPAEKIDTKVLETLVLLDRNAHLPIGLRVQAFIVGPDAQLPPGPSGAGPDGHR